MKTITLTLLLAIAMTSHAEVPGAFNYQGYLADASGAPVDDMTSMTFILYNVANGGVSLWATAQDVPVSQGLFSVTLGGEGAVLPPQVFNGPLYLEVIVNGETLQPRRPLQSAPYALKARDADTLDGLTVQELSNEIGQLHSELGQVKVLPGGPVGDIPDTNGNYQFVGGTVELSISSGQRVLSNVNMALATQSVSSTAGIFISLCAQPLNDSTILQISDPVAVYVDDVRRTFGYSGSALILETGTWKFGACVLNFSGQAITNNHNVNGWLMKSN